jgi:hypothetical protein
LTDNNKDVPLPLGDDGEPKRDFKQMFDLNRTTLTRDMVERYYDAMMRKEVAADDIKVITAAAKEAEYKPVDIAAMKSTARLKVTGKIAEAREKLEAMERVSDAIGMDLFSWSTARR